MEVRESGKLAIFGKNGKPIALLLAKIGCFEALFDLWLKVEKVENRRFLGKMASL